LREQDEELALLRQEIEDYVPIGGSSSGVGSVGGSGGRNTGGAPGGRERREAERARLEVWALRLAEDLKLYVRDSIKSCFSPSVFLNYL
jgi:hypothetical protein